MKKRFIKLVNTLCPLCMTLGILFSSNQSFIFWGEPDYPSLHDM